MTDPILCPLESDVPGDTFIPASVYTRPCRDCRRRVLTSRCSRKYVEEGRGHFACPDCATAGMAATRALTVLMPPGGEDDLRDFKRQEAERN